MEHSVVEWSVAAWRERCSAVSDRSSLAAVALVSLIATACEDAAPSNPFGNGGAVPERYQNIARTMESERVAMGVRGAALAIVEGGKVTFARGFGEKDGRDAGEVAPSTLFRIGSCSKMLTAIAVLQSVAEGAVELERPIVDYVSDFHFSRAGTSVANITVRNLLTHTSGILDIMEAQATHDDREDAALGRYIAEDFAAIGYPMVPPGTFYNYSNPNYMLVGRLGEVVRGQPYRTLMRERVFLPLGMNRTYATADEVLADDDFAIGRSCSQSIADCRVEADVEPKTNDEAWIRPPGGIWSSVLDLGKVARFLLHGDTSVLSTEQWQAMTSAQVSTLEVGDQVSYGFGVMVSKGIQLGPNEYYPVEMTSHGGAIPGYGAQIACARSLDFCVITLGSSETAQFTNTLVAAFRALPKLPETSPLPELSTHPERFTDYAGTYEDAFEIGKVVVQSKDKKLSVTIPKLDADATPYVAELTPIFGDTFVAEIDGMQVPLTFIADASGQFKYIRTRTSVPIRVEASSE